MSENRAPPPAGPHGPYDFGFPSSLVDIHFPHGQNNFRSKPWFWFITQQTPYYFQYIGNQIGGHGWQCEQFLPIIKVLPIDTQPIVPTTQVGFSDVTEAATRTYRGEPISSSAWGRFRWKGGSNRFWDVIGVKKPRFSISKGIITSKTDPVNLKFKDAVEEWRNDWNAGGNLFNAACQGVSGGGSYTVITTTPFKLPPPPNGLPGDTSSLFDLQKNADKYYFGPLPGTIIFQRGQALFWKGAYSFRMEVGQLDPTEWDMSVFPPQLTSDPLSTRIPSSVSGNYGGYSVQSPDFPQVGLNIN